MPGGGSNDHEGTGTGPSTRPGRLRRAWRHRSVKVVAVLLSVTLVAAVAGGGWLAWRYSQVTRVKIGKDVLEQADAGASTSENFLLVGSDSRAFVDGTDDVAAYGTEDEVGAPHADTILLVRTFPDLDRVAMVSFPRDLWVPIAGTGAEDRINAAVQGGPDRLVQTITERFGLPIHHYAQIDFRGFKGLVYAIDGVTIPFAAPVRDFDDATGKTLTGLDIPTPGCITLDGDQALAYVRSRHYQQLVEGEWQPDPAGDLNRIQRQQDFIRRTFHQTLSKGLLDPRRVDKLLTVAIENVQLDQTLGLRDLLDLGRRFRSLTPDALQSYALPTTPGTSSTGADVLFLDDAAAEPVLDVFRGRTTEPATPLASTVRVRVLNASGRTRAVQAAAFRLAAAGFVVPGIGTLEDTRLDRTRLRFGTGQEGAAELVAARVTPRPELVADPTIQGVDVVLDLGRDFDHVLEAGEVPATSTTAEPGTTDTTVAPAPAPTVEPATTTTALLAPEGC